VSGKNIQLWTSAFAGTRLSSSMGTNHQQQQQEAYTEEERLQIRLNKILKDFALRKQRRAQGYALFLFFCTFILFLRCAFSFSAFLFFCAFSFLRFLYFARFLNKKIRGKINSTG
jgi:hypothetical protein